MAVVSVMVFDVAGLGVVNDEYGFAVGDELLEAVGRRLRAVVPPGCTVERVRQHWRVTVTDTADPARAGGLVGAMQMRPLPTDGPVRHVYFHVRGPRPDEAAT